MFILAMPSALAALSKFSFLACLLAGLLACGKPVLSPSSPKLVANVQVKPIETLQPQAANATVYIRGRVGKQAPFLESRAYEVQDDSGSVWVVTTGPAPASGTEILLQARVRYQSIPLAGKEAGEVYLEEMAVLEQKPPPGKAASPSAESQ